MSEKNNYPQLLIHPNGTYNLLVAEGVQVHFAHEGAIEEFIKDKNIEITAGHNRKDPWKELTHIIDFWKT